MVPCSHGNAMEEHTDKIPNLTSSVHVAGPKTPQVASQSSPLCDSTCRILSQETESGGRMEGPAQQEIHYFATSMKL